MNSLLKTALTASLLVASVNAVAASSVDLTVKGLITPSACTPALSNSGSVDYGKISAKDLKLDNPTFLVMQALQLTVTCDAATLMALDANDNRAGSVRISAARGIGVGSVTVTDCALMTGSFRWCCLQRRQRLRKRRRRPHAGRKRWG